MRSNKAHRGAVVTIALAIAIQLFSKPLLAQHVHPPALDTTGKPLTQAMAQHSAHDMMATPAGVSMERMGSGTSSIPDAVTLPSRESTLRDWMLMTHVFAFSNTTARRASEGQISLAPSTGLC